VTRGNPKTARLNFKIKIICVDCNAEFVLQDDLVNPTVEVLPHRNRMVLLTVPNECPDCRNIRAVK